MAIDFIEDKEIGFQKENQSQLLNNIDFQPENNVQNSGIDFLEDKTPILQGKVEENVNPYDLVLKDNTLSKEQKIQKIKEIGEAEEKKIDKEHKKTMAKLYGGAALEIASAAIPVGGVARLGGQAALKLAKPALSQIAKKAIVKNVGSGVASGTTSGAIFGAGEALIEDKDLKGIAQNTFKGAGSGAIGGGLVGGIAGKVATKFGKTKDIINKVEKRTKQTIKPNYGIAEDKVRELIQNRRTNIDTLKFEAMQKIDKFSSQIDDIANELRVDSRGLREVLPFIRENTDLPVKNFNRPDLVNIYNNLTKEQKEVLRIVTQNHFDDMEQYWNNLAEIKNLQSNMSPEEYITHIWNISDKQQNIAFGKSRLIL